MAKEKATKSYWFDLTDANSQAELQAFKEMLSKMVLRPLDQRFMAGIQVDEPTKEEVDSFQFNEEQQKIIDETPEGQKDLTKQAIVGSGKVKAYNSKTSFGILRWPEDSSNPYYKGHEDTFNNTYEEARKLLVKYVEEHGTEGLTKLPGRIVVATKDIIKNVIAEKIKEESKVSQKNVDDARAKLFDTPEKNEDGTPKLDANDKPIIREGLRTQYEKAYNELVRLQAEKASKNLTVDRELSIDAEIQTAANKVAKLRGQISGIVQDIKKLEKNVVEEGKEQSVAEKRLKGVFKQATKEKKAEEKSTLKERITGFIQKVKQGYQNWKINRAVNSVMPTAPVVKPAEEKVEETVEETSQAPQKENIFTKIAGAVAGVFKKDDATQDGTDQNNNQENEQADGVTNNTEDQTDNGQVSEDQSEENNAQQQPKQQPVEQPSQDGVTATDFSSDLSQDG